LTLLAADIKYAKTASNLMKSVGFVNLLKCVFFVKMLDKEKLIPVKNIKFVKHVENSLEMVVLLVKVLMKNLDAVFAGFTIRCGI
jgi:hypothetical protein